jgi:hypothetical protein
MQKLNVNLQLLTIDIEKKYEKLDGNKKELDNFLLMMNF